MAANASWRVILLFLAIAGCGNLSLWLYTLHRGSQLRASGIGARGTVVTVRSQRPAAHSGQSSMSQTLDRAMQSKPESSLGRDKKMNMDGPLKVLKEYTPLTPDSLLEDLLPVRVPRLRVYVHSAITNRYRPLADKLNILLNGWDGHNGSLPFVCCLATQDGAVTQVLAERVSVYAKGELQSTQFNCPSTPDLHHTRVSFSLKNCDGERSPWLPVVYPKPGTLAICAKVAFGDLDPEVLVEWFELQRILGVSKVLVFVLGDLNVAARQVLNYYKLEGFADVLPFLLPRLANETKIRGFKFWSRGPGTQFSSDEQTAVLDCQERLAAYDFLAVHDLDEVLVADTPNKQLPALLHNLKKMSRKASNFVFWSENFVSNWGVGDRNTSLTLLKYNWRTKAMGDHVKVVQIPRRTQMTTTHNALPMTGYYRHWVSKKVATLHHYRSCKSQYKKCHHFMRHKDTALKSLESQLLKNVQRVPIFLRKPRI